MKKLLVILSCLFSSYAFSGQSEDLITMPLVVSYSTGVDAFTFSAGDHVGVPSCSTISHEWIVDLRTEGGKSMQALVMLAYALGKKVHVVGTGDCNVFAGDRELVNYLWIVE